jgi:hypothetical protein
VLFWEAASEGCDGVAEWNSPKGSSDEAAGEGMSVGAVGETANKLIIHETSSYRGCDFGVALPAADDVERLGCRGVIQDMS